MEPKVTIELKEYQHLKKLESKMKTMISGNVVIQIAIRDIFGENIPGHYTWCSDQAQLDEEMLRQIEILKIRNKQILDEIHILNKKYISDEINKKFKPKKWWEL